MADIFSKIIRDYNNDLERILEKKDFSEDVKNLLLSMLYKIENGYDDYKKVKVNVCSKNKFVEEILETIDKKCKKIEIVKPTNSDGKYLIEHDLLCDIDKENGIIKTFQNEKSILDAIIKIRQKDLEIKETYNMISKPISDLLLIGNNMNSLELITDFNGWSWDITKNGKNNLIYNNLYQFLILLLGNSIIDSWVNDRKSDDINEIPSNVILSSKYNESFGITKKEIKGEQKDYIEYLRSIFKEKYGEKLEEKFFSEFLKIIILECSKKDKEYLKIIENRIKQINKSLKRMSDNKLFIIDLSDEKKKITKQIEQIDKLLSNEKGLKAEYEKRNKSLPKEQKIFSVSHLKLALQKQRVNKLEEIKNINKKMEPKEFVRIKNELEDLNEFYTDLNIKDLSEDNTNRLYEKLENTFLKCFDKKVENVKETIELERIIYELRYYKLALATIEQKKYIDRIEETIINRACEQKILTKFSEDEKTNYLILKEIFNSRIIDLDAMAFELRYSKGTITINIFDGTTDDETKQIKLTQKTELSVKLNKKIKIWQ